ncbi:MAG TPA: DUF3085 domain-containing protein [Prosthecobacter sp.]|nr:DUF3085 domain-containing protein [Prosthecobacter sp.]
MKFRFLVSALAELIAHAKAQPDHTMPWGYDKKAKKPGLLLVKDSGVYLMSNGIPCLLQDGTTGKPVPGNINKVVYAEGHTAETWIGGDDYVEFFDITTFEEAVAKRHTAIIFDVGPSHIRVLFETAGPSAADVRARIEKLLSDKSSIWCRPTPRHRKIVGYPATARSLVMARWPKAVILNDMPLEQAVKFYAEVTGERA